MKTTVTLLMLLTLFSFNAFGNDFTEKSDEFNGSGQSLQPFWQVRNGDKSAWELKDGQLVIDAGFNQNLFWTDTTTRFYQVTDKTQFDIETSMVVDYADVCAVAGIVVYSATGDYVTLKLHPYHSNPTAALQFQRHLQGDIWGLPNIYLQIHEGRIPIQMRIKRDGNTYETWYKPDAQGDWIFVGSKMVALQGPVEIGIYSGICEGEGPGSLTVTYDYFRVTTDQDSSTDPNNSTFTFRQLQDKGAPVNIPDPNLRAAIEKALGKARGSSITQADMQNLTSLEVENANIQDLTGMEFATNLTKLDLQYNEISDVSPLAQLTQLTELILWENDISDISPLAQLTQLTSLDLDDNLLSDISPLAPLTNLTKLDLRDNDISDISPLAQLTQLTVLNLFLFCSQLSDISPLAQLTQLTKLNLNCNEVSDISPLAQLTQLTVLNLGSNEVSDISPLAQLTQLTELNLHRNQVSDISPLAQLTQLTYLNLDRNQVSDISPLAQLTQLTYLSLHRNQVSDISPLAQLTQLTELYLNNNFISDFSPIAGLIPNLKVYGNDNQSSLGDKAPVNIPDPNLRAVLERRLSINQGEPILPRDMKRLRSSTSYTPYEDRFHDKGIRNLTGMEFATNLTELNLRDNNISDVSPLAQLTQLTVLNLQSNNISDVSPLAQLTNLTELDLSSNFISDFSPIAGLIPNLRVYSEGDQQFVVYIGDPDIHTAIVKKLGYAPGAPIGRQDMQDLTSLEVKNANIQDLTGLELATNLTSLDLRDNQISDVSPLARIKSLTWLSLSNNNISDISPLAQLSWSPGGEVGGVTVINLFSGLKVLDLRDNNISDISPLAQIESLTWLGLSKNRLSDVSPLTQLIRLTVLDLSHNQISDFSPIAGLIPNLEIYENGYQEWAKLISGLKIDENHMHQVKTKDGDILDGFLYSGDNHFLVLLQYGATCGTTSAEMVLHYYGKDVGQKQIWDKGDIDTVVAGAWPGELRSALNGLGVSAKWYHRLTLDHLKHYVRQNRPPIILLRFEDFLHYVVVVGYNSSGDFLIADPNGYFRWLTSDEMRKGWSLKKPGLPNEGFGVEGGFENFVLKKVLTPFATSVLDGNNGIVPTSAPTRHFRPNLSQMQAIYVEGDHDWNPLLKTRSWSRTLNFGEFNFSDHRVSFVNPLVYDSVREFFSSWGEAYVEDDKRLSGNRVKVWGQAEYGKLYRGHLWVIVRAYKYTKGSSVPAAPGEIVISEPPPAETALLPNYPNPFNPETWIPYQLVQAADVKLTIYDIKGAVVRQLDLGHQLAGFYTARSKAAYWDGRNTNGEVVASGIYFYQFQAGDYSATRRMVILK